MHRLLFSLIAIASLIAAATSSAQEPQRIALVIGNQGYHPSVGALKNPHNDIALVASALTKQGFSVLPPVRDVRRTAILVAVRGFVAKLSSAGPGAVGFVYYSGHGAAEKDTGINYLIPVDASEPGSAAFWEDSVKLDEVLKLLEGARNAAKFIVFDACRNELQLPERTSDKGLIPVREHQGMFIAYATAPGRVASDRGTTSGPYAAALAAELAKPGLDHLNLFQNVKETVLASTNGVQQPWSSDGMTRRVPLTSAVKATPASATTPATQPSSPTPPMSEAALAWDPIKDTRSAAVLDAYAKQFAGTVYAVLARERLVELQRADQQRVASVQQPVTAPEQRREPAGEVPQVGQSFRDCNDGCPEMVVVPAGEFMMGEGKDQRRTTIPQPFAVGKFEVTFAEWEACVSGGGCVSNKSPSDRGWGKGRRPVIHVSWNDAKEYATWLSRKTGKSYRLLSEAEWEYAARAGTALRYSWGNDAGQGNANCAGCGSQWDNKQTAPVGSFKPNAFGLNDMHGNVWEWCEDAYDASSRVLRGGSWYYNPLNLRSAVRLRLQPSVRGNDVGFRLARTL